MVGGCRVLLQAAAHSAFRHGWERIIRAWQTSNANHHHGRLEGWTRAVKLILYHMKLEAGRDTGCKPQTITSI